MWPEFINTLYAWQWAVVLAVPLLLIALYFLKLRREPVEVPSTFLWRRTIEDLHVNSLWQRLRSSLLLLLQLLLIALLVLALLRPGWQGARLSGGRYVLLIDNSASMSAKDVEPNRLAEAKRRAAELIDQMGAGDVAMLISFAAGARVEQPFTSNRAELRRRLEAIGPTQQSTSLAEALRLAAGVAQSLPLDQPAAPDAPARASMPADLYIFSDGRCPPVPDITLEHLNPVFVPIGSQVVDNVAVLAVSTARRDRRSPAVQVFARLHNYGSQPLEAPLTLRVDATLVDADRITLPAGESRGVAFDLPELLTGVVELRVDRPDALPLDNVAWAVVEPTAPLRVLLVTPGNEPLQRALATPRAREMAQLTIEPTEALAGEGLRRRVASGAWDLIVFDRCQPAEPPPAHCWYIGSLPPGDAWQPATQAEVPQIIDLNQSHPLTQILDMGDVLVLEAAIPSLPPGGTVLVDSNRGPLIAMAPRESFEDLVQGFELVGSQQVTTNWTARRSFPVFVLNVLEYFHGQGGQVQQNVRPGETVLLRLETSADQVTVAAPDGQTSSVARGPRSLFPFSGTRQVGVYQVSDSGRTLARFAVNLFDPLESDLAVRPEAPLEIGHERVTADRLWQSSRRDLWKWLLLAAVAVLLLEWYIYNRRVYI